jgi:hypothetical protein
MSRVVVDTNIYVSAVMFGGLPGMVFDLGLLRAFTLAISPPLLDELEDKLRVKFGVSPGDAAAIRTKLESAAGHGRSDPAVFAAVGTAAISCVSEPTVLKLTE